jgi:hypothetical protein
LARSPALAWASSSPSVHPEHQAEHARLRAREVDMAATEFDDPARIARRIALGRDAHRGLTPLHARPHHSAEDFVTVRKMLVGRSVSDRRRAQAGARPAGDPNRPPPPRPSHGDADIPPAARPRACAARPHRRRRRGHLAEVGGNMAMGVGPVIAVLLVTLGLRAAMIVAIILPVVIFATLFTMNVIGLPIHQMSVTGLIVALGLMVDAGIVMTDEIGQRL